MHPTPIDLHEQPPQHLEVASSSHPRGLYLLFATEMWERFSYYGMRAVLVLFLTKAMMMDKAFASKFYGGYTSLIYLTPLIGGFISDRYWGNRRSITVGGLLMAVGQFTLFFSASGYGPQATHQLSHSLLYVGLGAMIVGQRLLQTQYFEHGRLALLAHRHAQGCRLYYLLHGHQPGLVHWQYHYQPHRRHGAPR